MPNFKLDFLIITESILLGLVVFYVISASLHIQGVKVDITKEWLVAWILSFLRTVLKYKYSQENNGRNS